MSTIPLQVQQPQIASPLQNVGQLLQMRDLSSQVAMRQAQTQQAQAQASDMQAQAQQRQRDLQDQNTVQQAMKDPAKNARIMTGDYSDVAGTVQPRVLQNMQTAQQAFLEQKTKTDTAQNVNYRAALAQMSGTLTGFSQMKKPDGTLDLDRINGQLQSTYDNWDKAGILQQAHVDRSQLPTTITDQNTLPNALSHFGGLMAAMDQVISQQTAQAKQKETEAAAKKTTADAQIAATQAAHMTDTGLTPEQKTTSDLAKAVAAETASRDREAARHNISTESTARFEAGTQAQRAAAETSLAASALGDKETNTYAKPHLANLAAGQSQMEKLTEAQQMLQSGNAEAQALAVPKIMTALVSGQGSGIRITQPEMNAIGKARGITGDVQAWMSRMSSGEALTPQQTTQLQGILSDVGSRIQQKMQISNNAVNQIQSAPDKQSKIAADQAGRSHLNALEMGSRYVGEPITLKNGKHVTVTEVHPDGIGFEAQ